VLGVLYLFPLAADVLPDPALGGHYTVSNDDGQGATAGNITG